MLRTDQYIQFVLKGLKHESNLDPHNGDHQISDATDGQELVELKTISQSVVKKAYNV